MRVIFSLAPPSNAKYGPGIRNSKMLVTPFMLIQTFIKRMLVDWPKCGSDPQDEGHLACLCRTEMIYKQVTTKIPMVLNIVVV